MCSQLGWLLVLLSASVGYECNWLPLEYRHPNHTNYEKLADKMITTTCQSSQRSKSIYACFTSVDEGEILMGCYDGSLPDKLRKLCKLSIFETGEKCDYDPKTPYGAFHPSPGKGMCCCTGFRCNRPPPAWLVYEDLLTPKWQIDLKNLGFFLASSTFIVLVCSLLGAVHYGIEMAVWTIFGRPEKMYKGKEAKEANNSFREISTVASKLESPIESHKWRCPSPVISADKLKSQSVCRKEQLHTDSTPDTRSPSAATVEKLSTQVEKTIEMSARDELFPANESISKSTTMAISKTTTMLSSTKKINQIQSKKKVVERTQSDEPSKIHFQ